MVTHVQWTRSVEWLTTGHYYCDVTSLLAVWILRRHTVFQQVLNISSANPNPKPLQSEGNQACAVRRRSVNCANAIKTTKASNKRLKRQSRVFRSTLTLDACVCQECHSTFFITKCSKRYWMTVSVVVFLLTIVNTFISLQQGWVVVLFLERNNVVCTGIQSR